MPEIGDIIYVGTALYIGHGEDDVVGGKATVTGVSQGMSGGNPECVFVTVKEHPRRNLNWTQFLSKQQDKLAKEFGDRWAYEDPDYNDYGERW